MCARDSVQPPLALALALALRPAHIGHSAQRARGLEEGAGPEPDHTLPYYECESTQIMATNETDTPSLDDILSRHGLQRECLDRECPRNVRMEIAGELSNWKMVGHCFKFPPVKIKDIERDNHSEEERKVALLDAWGQREGSEATYLKLADVLHRRNRRDLVEFLCRKIKATLQLDVVPASTLGESTSSTESSVLERRLQPSAPKPKGLKVFLVDHNYTNKINSLTCVHQYPI